LPTSLASDDTTDPAPVQTSEPYPTLPSPQYEITATLNYSSHHLGADERILYTNRTGEALNELVIMVPPRDFPGVFQLNRLELEAGQPLEAFLWEGSRLLLQLPRSLSPGDSLALRLSFELFLPSPTPSPDIRPIPFGYTSRQTNLVDWYPFIAPYLPGKGWLAHAPGYFGEYLVYESSDFEVNIRLTDQEDNLVIAASAPAEPAGEWRRYRLESARNFAWSVSHEYESASLAVGDVKVISYYFPFHESAGQAALKTTAEALALFSSLYGDYPHPLLSVVEADFLDGMEYEGLYFLSNGFYNLYQGTPAEYLVAISAHETAHQWFYGTVGNDQALEPWLDEALCTYHERLYFEQYYPQALDWWWTYRVEYYQPRGWVDGSIYNPEGYRAYRDAVYLNGARFLEELRSQIDDQAFFDFLRTYVENKSEEIATKEDFFGILQQKTNADVKLLQHRYFLNP